MADQIKTGPSLAEKAFSMFEKSWQILFMLYWFWPAILAHFNGPLPQQEDPTEPIPVSRESNLLKLVSWIGFLAIFFLAMIYFRQEAMLYNPDLPIKFIGNNPERYRSPAERNMPFIEVSA